MVYLSKWYLVITRVRVQETQELTPGYEVYKLVNTGKGKGSFGLAMFMLV
jgi:hypothetical protein